LHANDYEIYAYLPPRQRLSTCHPLSQPEARRLPGVEFADQTMQIAARIEVLGCDA